MRNIIPKCLFVPTLPKFLIKLNDRILSQCSIIRLAEDFYSNLNWKGTEDKICLIIWQKQLQVLQFQGLWIRYLVQRNYLAETGKRYSREGSGCKRTTARMPLDNDRLSHALHQCTMHDARCTMHDDQTHAWLQCAPEFVESHRKRYLQRKKIQGFKLECEN